MSDQAFLARILLACSRGATRLFRNNVAQAWVGQSRRFSRPETVIVQTGDVLIRKARPLHAGLHIGSGDLIGWTSREITAADVGKRVAVFTSLEGKQGADKLRKEQRDWLAAVLAAGGIAGEVRSVEEARALVGLDKSDER